MEGKKCFPFTSLLGGGGGGEGGEGDRNDSSRSGSLTVEVETTHESNSAFSTVCSTLSLTLLALENGGARSSLSVLRGVVVQVQGRECTGNARAR